MIDALGFIYDVAKDIKEHRSHHGSAESFGQTSMRVPAVRARPMVRSQSFPPIREASA